MTAPNGVVDAHVHLLDDGFWPEEWWDHVAAEWATASPERRPEMIRDKIERGLVDPDGSRMIAEMDASGVQAVVLLPLEWGPDFHSRTPWDVMNDHAVAMAERYPTRILAFFGVDPRRPSAIEAFERRLVDERVCGLKLYPSCGFLPDDPSAHGLYRLCVEHDVPVLFHTGSPLGLLDVELSHPRHLIPVVEAHPGLKIWLGHAGAKVWWEESLQVAERSESVYLETSAWLWDDSIDQEVDAMTQRLAEAKRRVGSDRIIFGSDHVSGRRVRGPGFMQKMVDFYWSMPDRARRLGVDLDERDLEAIMRTNALRALPQRS